MIIDWILANNDISWNVLFGFSISSINFDLCQIRNNGSSLEFAVRFPPTPSGDFLCFAKKEKNEKPPFLQPNNNIKLWKS